MTLKELLEVPYVANGRVMEGADCYGLTRLARALLFDKPWMPDYCNVEATDKRALTKAMLRESEHYKPCKPHVGAIACAYRGKLCTHIAIVVDVDGRPMILETNEPAYGGDGPRLTPIKHFESRFLKVVYYDD